MGIYMLPSDLNLNIGKTKGYNKKILVSSTDMNFDSNGSINKDCKKLLSPVPSKAGSVAHERVIIEKSTDELAKDCFATQHENLKMLTEKHNDDKLAITILILGAELNAYHFW